MKINKIFLFLFFIMISVNRSAFCADLPADLKQYLVKNFRGIVFKIDNSFVINNETFLPLVPKVARSTEEIEVVYLIPEGKTPKLFWFSDDWVFVKLIKQADGSQTIVGLDEIALQYKERFLKTRFSSDLVIPKGLYVKEELRNLVGDLPIKISGQEKAGKEEKEKKDKKATGEVQKVLSNEGTGKKGILYLTSSDTGKIVYFNLSDLSMIYHVQTLGAPLELAYDKQKNIIFVTDFAKDKIYQLKVSEESILTTLDLQAMSSPRDINLSEDGSLIYVVESLTNDFALYHTLDAKPLIKTKLPPNPTSFTFIKQANLIAVTCPSTNSIVFLNASDNSVLGQLKIEGGPEKIISDLTGTKVYVANRNGNNISVIDLAAKKVINTIPVGEAPTSLALDSSGKTLYVGNGKSSTISIINLETNLVVDTISLPVETQFPGDIEITQDGKWLIVTSETTNTISIIDLALKKIDVKLDVGATTHAAYIVESRN